MADKRLSPFNFAVRAEFAAVDAAAPGSRKFSGIAYGGGLITDHPYLGPMVIDIASTKFQTPSPALYDHKAPIGVIASATLDNQIRIEGKLFAGVNATAKEVAEMADAGMPWQMSVGVYPGSIEEVSKGQKVKVNGQQFSGPVTVFRNNRIRETSFCALGAATDTGAQVFSVDGDNASQPGANEMDQAEHDRIVADLNGKLTKTTEDLATANTQLKATGDRLTALETAQKTKETAERTEQVKALFKAKAIEFSELAAKPYVEMTAEQFAAVSAQMAPKPKLDPKLVENQAKTGTHGALDLSNHFAIAAAAQRYIAEQKKDGQRVEVFEAVTFVTQAAQAEQAA
jgi:hypothetical protein